MIIKCFALARYRIGIYLKKNTMIFFLFFMGALLSSLAFIFFYGNSMVDKRNYAQNDIRYRTFTLRSETAWTEETLYLLADGIPEALDVQLTSIIENPFSESNYLINMEAPFADSCTIIAFLKNNNHVYFYEGQTSFTSSQLGENVAILSKTLGNIQSFHINGIAFSVVGNTTNYDVDVVFIPLQSYYKCMLSANTVQLILPTVPSRQENNRLLERISDLFPEITISDPYEIIQADRSRNAEGIALTSEVYLISIVSFLFLFQYLIEQHSYENVVYSFVGARKSHIICITVIELTMISGFAALVACAIHILLYKQIFISINIYGNIRYELWDYLLCFCLTVFLSLAALMPFMYSYTRHSLTEMKRYYQH